LGRERKQRVEDLRLFRMLVDQSNDTFEVVDPKTGRFLDVNDSGCLKLGYSRDEYLSLHVWDVDPLVAEADWPQVAEQMRLTGSLIREGLHRRHKEGATFPIELNAKWIRLDRDYIVAVVRDISGRKQAEEVLRESELRFREMLENVELIAMTLDTKGAVTFCNDYLLKLTGWSREEVIGADYCSKFIPGNTEVKQLFFDTVAAGNVPSHHENSILTRAGRPRDIVWNNTMLRDAAGNIVGTASIGEDVTERKCAEIRVREQAAMLDQAHDAIIVRSIRTRRITFWNQGAERLYGWTMAEAIGRNVGELIYLDPDAADFVTEELLRAGEWRGEYRHVTKAGKVLAVSGHVTLVRDAEGAPQSALSINIDVTEQKELEARFLRAQRMESIGTLASGVAHDLNNILAPIMMSAPLLRRDLTTEKRDQIIATIEMSAERGAQIVKQVLTFGRGLEGERLPLRLDTLIEELMKIMRETFPKYLAIETSLEPHLWPVIGDATQLHQVLLNLCVNARDAMPERGKLRVAAANLDLDTSYASMLPDATPGPYVLLEVSDTGSGIPPEIIERIFDPFFTTKGIGEGTGLGLSTVLGIVKSHGGFLHVNTQPGHGTTFQVYLPASPNHEAALPETPRAPLPESGGELVLVVDDEPRVRDAARLVLETAGYRVLTAADGAEALAVFAMNAGSVAAVLTDLMMPFMDGVALIRALRTMAPILPIIASTGLGEKTQLAALKALGVETILHKPYRADTLLRTVHDRLHPAENSPTL